MRRSARSCDLSQQLPLLSHTDERRVQHVQELVLVEVCLTLQRVRIEVREVRSRSSGVSGRSARGATLALSRVLILDPPRRWRRSSRRLALSGSLESVACQRLDLNGRSPAQTCDRASLSTLHRTSGASQHQPRARACTRA